MAPIFTGSKFGFGKPPDEGSVGSSAVAATGGTTTPAGLTPGNGYKYHVFTSPGNFVVTSGGDVDILVVAGGGGGGGGTDSTWYPGSGGGAGGVAHAEELEITAATYAITVGGGGGGGAGAPGSNSGGHGSNGSNSHFGAPGSPVGNQPDYILAIGGGSGAGGRPPAQPSPGPGGPGGSGGGAPSWGEPGGTAQQPGTNPSPDITDYGYDGGDNTSATGASYGGGGASAIGEDGSFPSGRPSGHGGNGQPFPAFGKDYILSDIPSPEQPQFGPAVAPQGFYGGGGGGGHATNNGGAGNPGNGGGGMGGPDNNNANTNPASKGKYGTGGGGGGGGTQGGSHGFDAANGGQGIVIIRYEV